jgi:hypothetical protein
VGLEPGEQLVQEPVRSGGAELAVHVARVLASHQGRPARRVRTDPLTEAGSGRTFVSPCEKMRDLNRPPGYGRRVDPVVLRELVDVVGAPHVLTDATCSPRTRSTGPGGSADTPSAMVRPADTAEVAGVLDVCRRHGVAIVPQGGNTGMVGGSVPLAGELVLSTSAASTTWARSTWPPKQITAGAGATVEAVQRAAAAAGLRYAVDFGARGTATIGGSIATNAGGINVLRYGGTREQLLGVEAVLGTGEVISRLVGPREGQHRLSPGRAVVRQRGHARRRHRSASAAGAVAPAHGHRAGGFESIAPPSRRCRAGGRRSTCSTRPRSCSTTVSRSSRRRSGTRCPSSSRVPRTCSSR